MNIPESEFPVSGYFFPHGLAWVLPCFALTGPSTEGLCLESSGSVGILSPSSPSLQNAQRFTISELCVVDMTWYALICIIATFTCQRLWVFWFWSSDLQVALEFLPETLSGRVPWTLKLNHLPETTFRLCITITEPPKRRRNVIHHYVRFGFDQLLSFWELLCELHPSCCPQFLGGIVKVDCWSGPVDCKSYAYGLLTFVFKSQDDAEPYICYIFPGWEHTDDGNTPIVSPFPTLVSNYGGVIFSAPRFFTKKTVPPFQARHGRALQFLTPQLRADKEAGQGLTLFCPTELGLWAIWLCRLLESRISSIKSWDEIWCGLIWSV